MPPTAPPCSKPCSDSPTPRTRPHPSWRPSSSCPNLLTWFLPQRPPGWASPTGVSTLRAFAQASLQTRILFPELFGSQLHARDLSFPIYNRGMSSGPRRREWRPGSLLPPFLASCGPASFSLKDSVSPTAQCSARLGFHPLLSFFLQRDPPGQGKQFPFWASVYHSPTQRRPT